MKRGRLAEMRVKFALLFLHTPLLPENMLDMVHCLLNGKEETSESACDGKRLLRLSRGGGSRCSSSLFCAYETQGPASDWEHEKWNINHGVSTVSSYHA